MRGLTGHGSIDVQNIGLSLKQSGGPFDDPKCMVLPNSTFMEEVILEKVEIGFGRIVRSVELIICREADGRLRDLVNGISLRDMCVTEKERRTSLMIRSRVLMTAPLSRRCIERSMAGLFAGFLCSIS